MLMWLPLALWAPSASAVSAGWPSLPGLRGLLLGTPAPQVPRQETGSAAGLGHYVPASATRAGRGSGRPPGTGEGQLPPYHPHAQPGHRYHTGPAPAGFNRVTSHLVRPATTVTSGLYRNADGSYTRLMYPGPVNYRTASGAWASIDTSLSASDGRWRERANSLAVGFATRGDDAELASLGLGGGRAVAFGLAGAAAVAGEVSGSAISYPGVLAWTDLTEQAAGTGFKESLVLHSADAASIWLFPLRLRGLTPVVTATGSVNLVTAAGTVAVVIPAGSAADARRDPRSDLPLATAAAKWTLVTYHGGRRCS